MSATLVILALLLIGQGLVYFSVMVIGSRRAPREESSVRSRAVVDQAPRLFFVFLIPCLNEATVIWASIARLLAIPDQEFAVVVVDDASNDGTGAIVAEMSDPRVHVVRRSLPDARKGKGAALNAAVRALRDGPLLHGRDPHHVIVVVVDADGRLEAHALDHVTPFFDDPDVGAVQIGVRINNRFSSVLARMQDMEFVIYTDIFQRGRRHLGSVGLGGNGQFMRLAALISLGERPWSDSLTEDLDLGVRLIAHGWRNEFCDSAAVHQQGVVTLGRLVRQRTRWFQGHLQSWNLIPLVLREVPRRARLDVLYHLSSPLLLLISSLLTGAFALTAIVAVAGAFTGQQVLGPWFLLTYALAAGPAIVAGAVYWLRGPRAGLTRLGSVGLAHVYVLYSLIWYAAGWWAIWRVARGQHGWAKTARTSETVQTTLSPDDVRPAAVTSGEVT